MIGQKISQGRLSAWVGGPRYRYYVPGRATMSHRTDGLIDFIIQICQQISAQTRVTTETVVLFARSATGKPSMLRYLMATTAQAQDRQPTRFCIPLLPFQRLDIYKQRSGTAICAGT